MMRVYHSVFAAVVKSLAFLQNRLGANKKVRRGFFHKGGMVDGQAARMLWLVLVVCLLASSPSSPSTFAGWARDWQTSVAYWTGSRSLPTKLYRSLADSYGRYENWLGAYVPGKQSKTGNDLSLPHLAAYSAATGPMSAVPNSNVLPLPPDAPPVFTDDPLDVGVTFVQALHVTQLREAVNLVRARAGLAAASWELPVASGLPIKATHIMELRTRLDDARTALGLPAATYSPPPPSIGGSIRAAHVQELRNHIKEMLGTTTSADSALARLDPANRTGGGGEDPLSRNFNWSVPLVSLPGRAGLDLGLSLSYNSLVWTKRGSSSISFNDDSGFPSPGFRLGFPVIQPLHYNSEAGKYAFLLITPDGGHTELRQVNASALYEAADSSHLLLDTATMVLRTTDGTQLSYVWQGSDYQCTQIKDRNGNFITINYTAFGRISTVVDTLGRVITFNYDGTNYLTSITQLWNGQAHTWASFEYNPAAAIQTNFTGLTNLGPQNGSTIKVLSKVTLNDNSRFEFDYTTWGQVWKVQNYAADGLTLLNYRSYNLPLNSSTAQTDCPRFTERRDWAENWNRSGPLGPAQLPTGAEQEVLTTYAVPAGGSWTLPNGTGQTGTIAQITLPDSTYHKIYFAGTAGTSSGWQRGLLSMVETYSGSTRQRQSVTTWTQDNTAASYILNPRVSESNVYDPAGNRARTRVTYQAVSLPDGTSCKLPQDVYEYQANATTVLRRTHTDYNLGATYTNRRIIGLVSEKTLFEGDPTETLMSKVSFQYDGTGSIQGTDAPVQHDNANYTAGFFDGRGNLSRVKRYDVTNISLFTESTAKYNTAGAIVASIDALNHQVSMSYADSFSDGNNSRNTLAYPTTVTDADNFSSISQYNFDFGAVTRTQGPPPAGQTVGAIRHFTYDSLARIQKIAVEFNSNQNYSYTRFEYPTSQNRVDTYATMEAGLGEAHSFKITDGHGRVIAGASDHPGSVGGFSGQLTLFDPMGRAIKSSNPTETNASGSPMQWVSAGDDASAGWLYTQQTHDWKGRPLVTTNTDGTTKEASYAGCGCAGGEVVTLTDEGTLDGGVSKRRQQKIYSDILGRTVKIEVLNWQGGSVYSATVNTYNARDQLTQVRQYAGAEGSATYQDTVTTYDGYGRLKTKHVPEQDAAIATVYNYNSDDTLYSITDARSASQTFSYNARHLVTGVSYAAPAGITATAPVSYAYDAAGNRTSMIDGLGSKAYAYDQLSRMSSETRTINGVGTFPLSYAYNLAGGLTSISDPWSTTVAYSHNQMGQLTAVTGAGQGTVPLYASDMLYKASGNIKQLTYGNINNGHSHQLNVGYNARLQVSTFEVVGGGPIGLNKIMKGEVQYHSDGRSKYVPDVYDGRFDRSYQYDHVGRLVYADTGKWARSDLNGLEGPYLQSYQYDVWANMVGRQNKLWSQNLEPYAATYVNNRNVTWQYDAAGRIIDDQSRQNSYDAAGYLTYSYEDRSSQNYTFALNLFFDGDGRQLKRVGSTRNPPSAPPQPYTTYYLTSTILGGAVIAEIKPDGQKQAGYVYAGKQVLAKYESNQWTWVHHNPVTGSWLTTDQTGVAVGGDELDPFGAGVGTSDPYETNENPDYTTVYQGSQLYLSAGNPFDLSRGCTLDGAAINCSSVAQIVNSEVGAVAPPQTTQRAYNPFTGQSYWEFFRAFADGYQGFLPFDAEYLGDGIAMSSSAAGDGLDERRGRVALHHASRIPQNPGAIMLPVDADGLKSLIADRLKYGKCAEQVAKLIQKAATVADKFGGTDQVKSTDILTLFEEIRRQPQGGILFNRDDVPNHPEIKPVAGGGGWAWGSYTLGNAMINVYWLGYFPDRPGGKLDIPTRYGIRGLHEVIHKSGQHWGFDDDVLTRAARALEPNAGYNNWDAYLAAHCLPPPKR